MKILAAPDATALSSSLPVVSGLNQLLASSYALMANTQFAHWNIEGSRFLMLHEAFKQHYENLFVAVETLADRIRELNAFIAGGLSVLSNRAGIAEFTAPMQERDLVNSLIAEHRKVTADAIALCDAAAEAHDQVTHDIAIARIQWHEKTVWSLRNHLEASAAIGQPGPSDPGAEI